MEENKDNSGLYFCLVLLAALGYMILLVVAVDSRNKAEYWQRISDEQSEKINSLETEKDELNIRISELERAIQFSNEWIYAGEFKITYYWSGEDSYGSMTATGVEAAEGRTVAVDPAIIPYGTEILIDGHIYIAEDTGSAVKGNVIDIYVNEPKEEAYYMNVYVRK